MLLYIRNAIFFLFFVIIGSLTHELGHYFVARLLGYKAYISYGYTFYSNGLHSWSQISHKVATIWIISGGILMTIMIGTLGLIGCIKNRHYEKFSIKINICVCLALFWGRELYCFGVTVFYFFINGKGHLAGDETNLSRLLNLPAGFFSILLGGISFVICTYIFFFINKKYRVNFLLSAVLGTFVGLLLWFGWLGPMVLPVNVGL